jgi:hypothetical protein
MVEDERLGLTDEQRAWAALTLLEKGNLSEAELALSRWAGSEFRDRLQERITRERKARSLRDEGLLHLEGQKWAQARETLVQLRDAFGDTREALLHSDGTSHYYRRE